MAGSALDEFPASSLDPDLCLSESSTLSELLAGNFPLMTEALPNKGQLNPAFISAEEPIQNSFGGHSTVAKPVPPDPSTYKATPDLSPPDSSSSNGDPCSPLRQQLASKPEISPSSGSVAYGMYPGGEPPRLKHPEERTRLPASTPRTVCEQNPILASYLVPPAHVPVLPGMDVSDANRIISPAPTGIVTPLGTPYPIPNKKRKLSLPDMAQYYTDLNILGIKTEPRMPGSMDQCPPTGVHQLGGMVHDSDIMPPGSPTDLPYQIMPWDTFQQETWASLLDVHGNTITVIHRVEADKGFNFSPIDCSFVCQKKNHFQITIYLKPNGHPTSLRTPDGRVLPLESLFVNFYGVKHESVSQTIAIEQSQSDRSKVVYNPHRIDQWTLQQDNKITIGRLHFTETTSNNMRKKGKPNPDQRYFKLVVALQATVPGVNSRFTILAQISDRIVVRASNPGQFETDSDTMWQRGSQSNSVFHLGPVGINTEKPDEALCVVGNVKVHGQIVQPSDRRVKECVAEVDCSEQLNNIRNIRIYKYSFTDDFAATVNLPEDCKTDQIGFIAQELEGVLPDAVRDSGDFVLADGTLVHNFKVVNKDRVLVENVGALKGLSELHSQLERRIDEIENQCRRRQFGTAGARESQRSTRSNSSSVSTISIVTVKTTPSFVRSASKSAKRQKKEKQLPERTPSSHSQSSVRFEPATFRSCSSSCKARKNQRQMCYMGFFLLLFALLTLCLSAVVALYMMQRDCNNRLHSSCKGKSQFDSDVSQTPGTVPTIHSSLRSSHRMSSSTRSTKSAPSSSTTKKPPVPPTILPVEIVPKDCNGTTCNAFCCAEHPSRDDPAPNNYPPYKIIIDNTVHNLSSKPEVKVEVRTEPGDDIPYFENNFQSYDHYPPRISAGSSRRKRSAPESTKTGSSGAGAITPEDCLQKLEFPDMGNYNILQHEELQQTVQVDFSSGYTPENERRTNLTMLFGLDEFCFIYACHKAGEQCPSLSLSPPGDMIMPKKTKEGFLFQLPVSHFVQVKWNFYLYRSSDKTNSKMVPRCNIDANDKTRALRPNQLSTFIESYTFHFKRACGHG